MCYSVVSGSVTAGTGSSNSRHGHVGDVAIGTGGGLSGGSVSIDATVGSVSVMGHSQ